MPLRALHTHVSVYTRVIASRLSVLLESCTAATLNSLGPIASLDATIGTLLSHYLNKMQPYISEAPIVEVQQDQQEDTLAQLQESLQEQLQHQLSNSSPPSAAASNTDTTTASEATAAGDAAPTEEAVSAEVAAAVEAAVDAVLAGATDSESLAAAAAAGTSLPATAGVAAGRASSVASGGSGDDEWHLVSPGGSVRMHSSSGRYSFECAGAATPTLEVASSCGSDTTSTPKDTLAESILGHPVLMAAAAANEDSIQAASVGLHDEHAGLELGHDDVDVLRAASRLSSEGSLDGLQADTAAAVAGAVASDPASAAVEVECIASEPVVVDVSQQEVLSGLGLLSGEIVMGLAGIKEWIMESLAALVQSGRHRHAACISTAHSLQRNLQLAAKQGNLLAAAAIGIADWRVALSSAAAVVCLAMYLKSRQENTALRTMLRRRDHELSKLVMRVVSLQELLNQGQALPITRYMRYEGAGGPSMAAANYL